MSWRPMVIADSTGKWLGDALRFGTEAEAEAYVADLADRWGAVRETRAVEVDEPVTDLWTDGRHVLLTEAVRAAMLRPEVEDPE